MPKRETVHSLWHRMKVLLRNTGCPEDLAREIVRRSDQVRRIRLRDRTCPQGETRSVGESLGARLGAALPPLFMAHIRYEERRLSRPPAHSKM